MKTTSKSKPSALQTGAVTKAAKATKAKTEEALRGDCQSLEPLPYLTDTQKAIFNFVVTELVEAGTLGNLDTFVISSFAVSAERIQRIDREIEASPEMLYTSCVTTARSKYMSDFWRGVTELCLSPSARAKAGSLIAAAKEKESDELLAALKI